MLRIRILVQSLAIIGVTGSVPWAQHWYSSDGRTPLVIDSTRVLFRFNDSISLQDHADSLLTIGRVEKELVVPFAPDSFVVCSLNSSALALP